MKKFLVLFFLLFSTMSAWALSIPEKPESYVNDYARLLSPAVHQKLESVLSQFEKETSNQIVVAIFDSLEGGSLEDFSIRLADKWKIGSKKNNNGVILLIFKNDRKVRIEVGYGLEGALPDVIADQIIRHEIVPAFREGNFDAGVENAVTAVIQATKGEYKAKPEDSTNDKMQAYSPYIFLLFILYLVAPSICYLLLVVISIMFFGYLVGLAAGLFITVLLVIVRQMLFSSFFGQTFRSSGRGGFGGVGYGGGGFGGGGFSGGFGGGGGGSFGGGGASGSW